jgi:hypothetical protein
MSSKFFSNLAVVAVGATLGSLALQAAPAQAATFNFSFTTGANLIPAAANQPATGTFTFNESLVNPTAGFQTVPVTAATFNILGQTFNQDQSNGGVVVDYFINTPGGRPEFAGLAFEINPDLFPAGFPLISVNTNDSQFNILDSSLNLSSGTVTYTPAAVVPTPALLPGLVGLGFAAIRKRQAKKVAA